MINRKGSILFAIIAICSLFFMLNASVVSAALKAHPSLYRSSRIMGMGGANVAIGGTFESVFHNPAGIAKMPENNWEFNLVNLNIELSENALDFATDLMDATEEDEDDALEAVNDQLAKYKGENMHLTISDLVSLAKNNGKVAFGVGLMGGVDSNLIAHEGIGEDGLLEVHADIRAGGIGAMSYQVNDNLYAGASLKYIHKESIDHFFTATEIIEHSENEDLDTFILDEVREKGNAVGVDVGVIYEFMKDSKYKPAVGFSLQNIGGLDFGDAGEIPMTANIGVSIKPEIPKLASLVVGLDYVDLFNNYDEDSDIGKRVRFGAEVGLFDKKMASMKVRAGLYQGYPTFGADLRLFLVTLSYTTYAEEVGAYAGQDDDRRHLIAMNVGW